MTTSAKKKEKTANYNLTWINKKTILKTLKTRSGSLVLKLKTSCPNWMIPRNSTNRHNSHRLLEDQGLQFLGKVLSKLISYNSVTKNDYKLLIY